MCISAPVSFSMAGLLAAGGGFCIYKALCADGRYLPLSLFPVLVGIQQYTEGLVWLGALNHDAEAVRTAALVYFFFAWMIWPVWIPYMALKLELVPEKRAWLRGFMAAGLFLGALLYLPNFWHPGWLRVEIINHSIAYQLVFLSDAHVPEALTAAAYLALVGLPPLLSSHRFMQRFGIGLAASAVLTYLFFFYAKVSVLCFFAAAMTLYIIYAILTDQARLKTATA